MSVSILTGGVVTEDGPATLPSTPSDTTAIVDNPPPTPSGGSSEGV